MAYRELSQEEIEAIVQTYPDAFKNQFQEPLDYGFLSSWLSDRRDQKIREAWETKFGTNHPNDLKMLSKMFSELYYAQREEANIRTILPPNQTQLIKTQIVTKKSHINKAKRV